MEDILTEISSDTIAETSEPTYFSSEEDDEESVDRETVIDGYVDLLIRMLTNIATFHDHKTKMEGLMGHLNISRGEILSSLRELDMNEIEMSTIENIIPETFSSQ